MVDKFEEVLQKCLEYLEGDRSVEECLAQYPEEAGQLEPLLQTALASRRHLAIEMAGATRARLRGRVMAEWDQHHQRRRSGGGILFFSPRLAAVAASVILNQYQGENYIKLNSQRRRPCKSHFGFSLVVALSGVGTVAASGGAVPGEPLYVVKEFREAARLWFVRSPEAKVEMYTRLVKERAEEVQELAAKQNASSGAISHALERMDGHLATLDAVVNEKVQRQRAEATAPDTSFLEALQNVVDGQQSVQVILIETLDKVPDQAQLSLGAALEAIQQAQERVRTAVKASGPANSGDLR